MPHSERERGQSTNSTSGIRLGIQPTGWTNDDFPEIGNEMPYQQILSEIAATGFEGGSTGHNYPTHLPSLLEALKAHKLGITSTWVGTQFTAPDQFENTLSYVSHQIEFLRKVGAKDIVVAELASAVNQVRVKSVFDDRPIFNEPQWGFLQRGLNEAGRMAAKGGMRLSYHPHLGTGVQVREEVDRLLRGTDQDLVSLCLDTGHVLCGGIDPLQLATDYIDRINHVHLKNVRKGILEQTRSMKCSFFQAIMDGIFTVPGDSEGCIDFRPILDLFKAKSYEGWIVVEAEQDPHKKPPVEYARMAREFIKTYLGV
jgi:inosose dehydratase